MRTVLVPSKVMTLFQNLAQSNTNKNIETCGILAGKLVIIVHLKLSYTFLMVLNKIAGKKSINNHSHDSP